MQADPVREAAVCVSCNAPKWMRNQQVLQDMLRYAMAGLGIDRQCLAYELILARMHIAHMGTFSRRA